MAIKIVFSLLFTLALAHTSINVDAQPITKDFLLGGNFGIIKNKTQYPDDSGYMVNNSTYINSGLQIGFFISPRWAIGASISFFQSNYNEYKVKENSTGSKTTPGTKFRIIELSGGGFASYYYPVREKLLWVNTIIYQHGFTGDGISMDTYFSNKTSTLARYGFNSYSIASGIHYFISPAICLTATTHILSIRATKNSCEINLLKEESFFSIGLNYLLKNE